MKHLMPTIEARTKNTRSARSARRLILTIGIDGRNGDVHDFEKTTPSKRKAGPVSIRDVIRTLSFVFPSDPTALSKVSEVACFAFPVEL